MNITEVRVFLAKNDNKRGSAKKSSLLAYASITLEDAFVVTGLRLIAGKKAVFVTMPQAKSGDDYYDVAFPLSKELRQDILEAVLDMYYNKIKDAEEEEAKRGARRGKK